MNTQTDDASRPGDCNRPCDAEALSAVEHRLQAALKQEAEYWERREPAHLRSACRAPRASGAPHVEIRARLLWVGALAATVACALVVFARHSWRTSVPMAEPRVTVVSGDHRAAVVFPCTDVTELYARLPSCPPLQRPPPPLPPPPPSRLVIN